MTWWGPTVLILEPEDQVVVVNVVGRLDLALLAQLADSLDIPALDIEGFEPDRRGDDADGGALGVPSIQSSSSVS